MKENLYILIEMPVLGELGPDTNIIREKICEDCGRLKVTYEHIEIKFDRWSGEDFFAVYGISFISERLLESFKENEIKGMDIKEVSTSKASNFKIGKKAYMKELPKFYHMTVTGKALGPDLWWKKTTTCDTCGNVRWIPTKEGLRSAKGPSLTGTKKDVEDPLPRRVFFESWKGDDIFLLQDPVQRPIVTEKFKTITDEFGNDKLFYRETEWVEESDEKV